LQFETLVLILVFLSAFGVSVVKLIRTNGKTDERTGKTCNVAGLLEGSHKA